MKSLFSYSDYRSFLLDYYEDKKNQGSYSYRQFSMKAGLNSPNYLALIIEGKRDLTTTNIHQFAEALHLRGEETEYFETLVHLNQSQSPEEKRFYENRRRKLIQNKPQSKSKKLPNASLQDWHYTAVLVLAHGRSCESALAKAQQELGIKKEDIQKTLTGLIELGLLTENQNAILEISSAQVTFNDPKSLSVAQENFLAEQLEQSRRAFRETYKNKSGKFISHTLTVPPGAIPELHQKMISWVEELTEEMDSKADLSNAELAQINVQIFKPKRWK